MVKFIEFTEESEFSSICKGQKICASSETQKCGKGTYERDGLIHASLLGHLRISQKEDNIRVVEVRGEGQEMVVPGIDDVVTVRITSVNPRFCKCSILSVGETTLRDTFRGVIRCENVRATEKDRVEMARSFRPGDIVIAKVISLGDSQSFLLTTAENELGVVVAISDEGVKMVPISWCEMQCPKTYIKQYRKVAKVQDRYIDSSTNG